MPVVFLSILLLIGFVAGTMILGTQISRRSTYRLPLSDSRETAERVRLGVSVIVPARNEELRLPALLETLMTQSVRPLEVLVVDDESTDHTACVAREYGARVIATPFRPEGWVGKTWACNTGALEAGGDLLLFLDADVELDSTALERILAAYQFTGGAVSVQPYHRTVRMYESFSALFNAQVVTAVGVGASSRGLFGPCIIIDKDGYLQCGGHESVRSSVLDDVDFGRCCLAHGLKVRNFLGGNEIRFRMYPGGLREVFNGWTRNFLQGAGVTPTITLLIQSFWMIGAVTAAVQSGFALAGSPLALLGVWPTLMIYAAYASLFAGIVRAYGNFGIGVALSFPLHLLFFGCIMVRSWWLRVTGAGVEWRGRRVQLRPRSSTNRQKSVEFT